MSSRAPSTASMKVTCSTNGSADAFCDLVLRGERHLAGPCDAIRQAQQHSIHSGKVSMAVV
jgi:hypothetical protein